MQLQQNWVSEVSALEDAAGAKIQIVQIKH